ncbi:MAG TPA: hypothetical protein VG498_25600 [Terriglobales bacterium]|nr:hypothetical protein [Terriglobales bacterium]
MRSFSLLFTSLSLAIYVGLLASCGSSGSNNTNNSNTSASAPGGNGPGSGSSGSSSGGSGSAGSGSGNSGSSGSGSGNGGSGAGTSFVSFAYTASTNAIVGYGVNSDGSLAPLPGSPYAASLAQNTNIVTNGANLYATAQGQTNLDIFSIDKSNGALTLANTSNAIAGDPNQGDIAFHLALDHTGASLYVGVGTNIDGGVNVFAIGSSPNAQPVQYLAGPSLPLSPRVFSPNNQYAYTSACTARVEGIFGYTRVSDATLKDMNPGTPQPPSGNPGEAFCPQALATSAKGYLAIVWYPFGYASSGQVGTETYVVTYTINADGTLTAVANSQIKTASSSANKVVANFDPTGSFLAVAGDGGAQTFAMNANGTLAAVGSPQSAGANFQDVTWDNSNHVFAANSSQLYVFDSSTGVLTLASGSPHAGGPQLTVFPIR